MEIAGYKVLPLVMKKQGAWGMVDALDVNMAKEANARYLISIHYYDGHSADYIAKTSALIGADGIASLESLAGKVVEHFEKNRLRVNTRTMAVINLCDLNASKECSINAFVDHGKYVVKSHGSYGLRFYYYEMPEVIVGKCYDTDFAAVSALLGKHELLGQKKQSRYSVTYISSTDHGTCSVWVNAESEAEARDEVRSEYWDIERIISVRNIG